MNSWNSFTRRIIIKAPIERIYQCWTKQAEIEVWFLESALFFYNNTQRPKNESFKKGDLFQFKWHNWNQIESCTILQAIPYQQIAFTFGTGGEVHVSLTAVTNGTEVVLKQNQIPTDEESKLNIYVGCNNGWTFWLTNLKAYIEYGITLNAKGLNQSETTNLVNS